MLLGKEVGPFTIERQLGSGAMGAVYLARYKNGQRVALKFLSQNVALNPKALDRFEREADILKQLRHPNIVRLFGAGRHQKMPYYAMEYIEGETLAQVLERRGRLPWEEVVNLGRQLCAALQHAHEQGIIHRDLKPSNLMVLSGGTLKLTDFGIAKDLDLTALTEANCTVGTASYMSPEQCKGERNLTHKSDLYSLGIVFYELLTGQKPFVAENSMDMFLQHVQGKFEPPSRLVMDIPPWLNTLVCQMLEKKPEKRPFDAAVVGAALEQIFEKVTAQRSAGADAVTAGSLTGARVTRATLGAEDKEAARTLAQSLGKGKKKRKSKPFYQRAWFQALGVGVALLAVGGLIVLLILPPSPDTLYAEAKRLIDSGDQAKKDKARDGPIKKYLALHGRKMEGSDQLKQVQAWADDIDTERRETSLIKQMKIGMTPEPGAESAARQAISQEEAGEFNNAVATWQGLLKGESEGGDNRLIALVAKKRLRDLKAADDRLLALQQKADLIRNGQDLKADSESEEAAIEALRFEKLGDAAMARRRWQTVKLKNEGDAGDRTWLLIAARGAKEQKDKAPKAADEKSERDKLLAKRLDAADKLLEGQPTREDRVQALLIAQEVQLLYGKGDVEGVKDAVERARKLIQTLGGT